MGINAFGTLFKMGDGATPEIFTTVAEVFDISGPSMSKDAIETTHHGSTNGWREFISGLKDGGEVTLSMNFLPQNSTQDDSTGVISQLSGDTVDNYQVVLPDDDETTITFAAVVTAFEIAEPVDDRLTADATFKVSGQPVFSTVSA